MVQMLINSLRMVHEVYTPKSRHVSDSVREMNEQVGAITGYLETPSAPSGIRTEGAALAAKLKQVTNEMLALIQQHPELDPRTPALPVERDMTRAANAADS